MSSSWLEIQKEYCYGRSIWSFITDNELEELSIFSSWKTSEEEVDTNMYGDISTILAYFDNNIIANVDTDYLTYKSASVELNEKKRKEWKSLGVPDMLIGPVDLEWVYGDEISLEDYTVVHVLYSDHIWKGREAMVRVPIFLRSDLLDEYGLQQIEASAMEMYSYTGSLSYDITDDMIEAYKGGDLTIDEILDDMGL